MRDDEDPPAAILLLLVFFILIIALAYTINALTVPQAEGGAADIQHVRVGMLKGLVKHPYQVEYRVTLIWCDDHLRRKFPYIWCWSFFLFHCR